MFSLFSKQKISPKESLFIHIPKTGGSTFVGVLKESVKNKNFDPATPSHQIDKVGTTHIKHVNFNTLSRVFKAPGIFNSEENAVYQEMLLFMLVRNPIERLVSEFNFQYHILDGKNGNNKAAIISKMKKKPTSLEDYIQSPETQDYQTKFLLGRPIADRRKVADIEFSNIINAIENVPIHCGVTDEYASFLNLFEKNTGIILTKKILVRKKTPFLYYNEISPELKKQIIKLNSFDYSLYEYVKSRMDVTNKKFQFIEKDQFIV